MKKPAVGETLEKNGDTILSIPVSLPDNPSIGKNEYGRKEMLGQLQRANVVGNELFKEFRLLAKEHGRFSNITQETISFEDDKGEFAIFLNYRILKNLQGELIQKDDSLVTAVKSLVVETSRLLEESSQKSREGIVHSLISKNDDSDESTSVTSTDPRAVKLARDILGKNLTEVDKSQIRVIVENESEVLLDPNKSDFIAVEQDNEKISFNGTIGCVDEFQFEIKAKPRSNPQRNSNAVPSRPIKISIKPKYAEIFLEMQRKKSSVNIVCSRRTNSNNTKTSKKYELDEFKVAEDGLF